MIRPCPKCGEARQLFDSGDGTMACVRCGTEYPVEEPRTEYLTPALTKVAVIKRGTRKADGPKGGCLR